eukprot:XP_001697075.1 hypothetical protein CHLREDRAFT_158973 [Chlamydomonas reinhardtii]
MPLLFGVLALLAATSTVTGQMVEVSTYLGSGGYATYTSTVPRDSCCTEYWSLQLSELEVNLPGSDVSVPSSFIIQGYTYVYDACQDISFKTRRFYSDASTAADLGITTFSVPPSAQKIRVAGEATLGCTFTNETRCPNVSAVLDINWACNSPGPITGRYTADQHYPGNRLQTVQVGTYCPTGFPNVIAFKDGGVIKTGTQTSSTYGYDAKRTSSRYKAPGKNAGR